ncbi:MAG: aminotransferase class I/II-fold pyridoxal phosphate-dependent enzyme, partial [Psychrobacter sp.]
MSKIQADSAQDQRLAQAERLVQLRRDKGLTAEQLAQAMTKAGAKVSRGAISNWERGINGIVSSKLPTLAHILGCTEGYLLRGDSVRETSSNNNNTIRQSSSKSAATPLPTSSADTNQDPKSSSTYLNNTADTTVYQVKDGTTMTELKKSEKLQNVCYDIRGPLLKTANKMEAEGQRILKLNVGNPAPFGLEAPHEILRDVAMNLPEATGYSDSQGIFSARKAVLQYYQSKGLLSAVDVRDVYLGNGVSELIVMTMQALMNDGDEVLIPMPDYPLWTAATNLSGGTAVHYRCNEDDNWQPDIEDIKSKIT